MYVNKQTKRQTGTADLNTKSFTLTYQFLFRKKNGLKISFIYSILYYKKFNQICICILVIIFALTHLTQQQSLILIFLPPEEEFYEFKIILCTQGTIGNWSIAIYMKESSSPHMIREAKNWKIPFFSKNIVTDDACLKMKD